MRLNELIILIWWILQRPWLFLLFQSSSLRASPTAKTVMLSIVHLYYIQYICLRVCSRGKNNNNNNKIKKKYLYNCFFYFAPQSSSVSSIWRLTGPQQRLRITRHIWRCFSPSITLFFYLSGNREGCQSSEKASFLQESKIESAKKFSFVPWIQNLTTSTNILLNKLIYTAANVLSTFNCLFLSIKPGPEKAKSSRISTRGLVVEAFNFSVLFQK